ncbi:hypothetical protein [Elizabethkingia meningoseptica]|uniref:hypothetical protein n=1 Tax=Elizabethkingia meningoseptica TaxID=238 RepID=UPI000841F3CA|nr:hypothetical protein [Elizabethkingia meningoseptica]AQX10874.1 hypothetical protein BBD35_00125 [Elizabethkingia meningoseptica]ODM52283.1 hypothetical protein BES09_16030 [Elizabethkingia meningoseptica]OHT26916.1 hypothetical protein BFF93_15345 [Elizabethkingia meningoseptica]OPB71119.1 hypothetical protein BAY31_13315 [Elizabethkingia meningoseptica]
MINIILDEKKTSVSIRYNAYYKLVILLAIINYCGSKNKAGLQLIHLMFWALRNETHHQVLYDVKMKTRTSLIPWSFEFGLEKVLALGYIEEYLDKKIVSNQLEIILTKAGIEILNTINEAELFQDEINKIKLIGWIPKTQLERANNNWKLL